MATKTCVNGHLYDPNVYGNNCPFCPTGATINVSGDVHGTEVSEIAGGTKPTVPVGAADSGVDGGGTVIRHVSGASSGETGAPAGNRRLVGLLVCYDLDPLGEVYKIYEGRNTIGRRATCDIVLSGDSQISSDHLFILYREAEGVFWAIDNNSSNGTFVNERFENKAQLQSDDVITIGSTRLIFMAIPRLPQLK